MNKKDTGQVLQDHARKGKRFIPPFVDQLWPLQLQPIQWIDSLLPELLWIGLIIKRYGLKEGIRFCSIFSKAVIEVVKPQTFQSLIQISEFSLVLSEHVADIKRIVGEKNIDQILTSIQPLVSLYPGNPLRNFFSDTWVEKHPIDTKIATTVVKEVVALMLDRRGKFGMYIQTTAYYLGMISGQIKISADLESAHYDLNWILDYPNTENSLKLAGTVRCTVNANGKLADQDSHIKWCGYFWNRGLEISPCEFTQ